jgi:hypothetical protein
MITPVIYAPGANGVPGTSVIPLSFQPTRYTHSIAAVGGFESASLDFAADLETALYWLKNLMASAVMCGPDAETVWEGFLSGVSVSLGQEQIDLSLDDLANAVKVRYQSDIGVNTTTAFTTDTASIATYGRRELVYSGSGMTSTGATALRDALLASRKNPLARRTSEVRTGGGLEEIGVTLTFTGWYYALDWLVTSSTTTSTTSTTGYVTTLLTNYNSINNFFSTSAANITASGVSETQYIDADTTYRAAIEKLLNLGTSSGQRQAWGIYEGRAMTIKPWAGASPTTITYQRSLADGRVFNSAGGVVEPWNVRPDAMYQVIELLDPAPVASAQDDAARYYVERVTCTVDSGGASVRLEPARSSGVDVLLARLR